ncbi:Cupin domain-containing protein [Asanoa hainanensis]|uniref:Cupin domain-containing protein n=1 Tax=Asanoa hainanensis TaxID=560556 RepID=A0A239PEV2_9ACTN|nr:cupin domain-containing protein [Asanoa hainanensis]SNT65607.1 Cupin domain-containing protein [Asanoa hainanensis]
MTTFPGGTAVTDLTVYDWPGPDGLPGGSAHVHLVCTEGYVVLEGRGWLQTLGADGFAETPLTPGTVAWFAPGVVHRLVNDGNLRILVVMQNAGLPEAGDAVLTFPPEHLTDGARYRASATLQADDPAGGARRRKDLAVDGFLRLRSGGPQALAEFYARAAALVGDGLPGWRERWRDGPLAATTATGDQLDHLAAGDVHHLHDGRLTVLTAPPTRGYGMCGRLATFPQHQEFDRQNATST